MSPLELIAFVESMVEGKDAQLNALALLSDAPGEDYQAKIPLPTTNELPAIKLGNNSLGANLANVNYGVAAPVPGKEQAPADMSIGQLLTGDLNG